MKKSSLVLTGIILITSLDLLASPSYPEGWRDPYPTEIKRDSGIFAESNNYSISLSGDYNNDGIKDFVKILVNDSSISYAIYSFVSKGNKYVATRIEGDHPKNGVRWVRLLPNNDKSNCFFSVNENLPTTRHCWDANFNQIKSYTIH